MNDVSNNVMMPRGCKVLSVGEQNNRICLWVEFADVNKDAPYDERKFVVVGTGWCECRDDGAEFIGTVKMNNDFVFHVFEIV